MVEEEADIEETEATWEDDTQIKTNVDSGLINFFDVLFKYFCCC